MDQNPGTVARNALAQFERFGPFAVPQRESNFVELGNEQAIRNLPISEPLQRAIRIAIETVYGQGHSARVYSGGQPPAGAAGRRVGSTRHDGGNAADVYVYGPQGRLMGDALAPLARYWLANNRGGLGLEMRDGGVHLDSHTDRAPFWTYSNLTPAQRAAVDEGLAERARRTGGPAPSPAEAGAVARAALSARARTNRGPQAPAQAPQMAQTAPEAGPTPLPDLVDIGPVEQPLVWAPPRPIMALSAPAPIPVELPQAPIKPRKAVGFASDLPVVG